MEDPKKDEQQQPSPDDPSKEDENCVSIKVNDQTILFDCAGTLADNIQQICATLGIPDPQTLCLRQKLSDFKMGPYITAEDSLLEQMQQIEPLTFALVKKPSLLAEETVRFLSTSTDDAKLRITVFTLYKTQLRDPHFAEEFIERGGVQALISFVEHSSRGGQSEALKALNATLSYVSGMRVVLQTPGLVEAFFHLVEVDAPLVRRHALETLFVITSIAEEGFRIVHRAAKAAARTSKQQPYESIIRLLEDQDLDAQINALTLLNVLRDNAPDDFKRAKFKYRLEKLGIVKIMKRLSWTTHADFQTQMRKFQEFDGTIVPGSWYECDALRARLTEFQRQVRCQVSAMSALFLLGEEVMPARLRAYGGSEEGQGPEHVVRTSDFDSDNPAQYKQLESRLRQYQDQQNLLRIMRAELLRYHASAQAAKEQGMLVEARAPIRRVIEEHDLLENCPFLTIAPPPPEPDPAAEGEDEDGAAAAPQGSRQVALAKEPTDGQEAIVDIRDAAKSTPGDPYPARASPAPKSAAAVVPSDGPLPVLPGTEVKNPASPAPAAGLPPHGHHTLASRDTCRRPSHSRAVTASDPGIAIHTPLSPPHHHHNVTVTAAYHTPTGQPPGDAPDPQPNRIHPPLAMPRGIQALTHAHTSLPEQGVQTDPVVVRLPCETPPPTPRPQPPVTPTPQTLPTPESMGFADAIAVPPSAPTPAPVMTLTSPAVPPGGREESIWDTVREGKFDSSEFEDLFQAKDTSAPAKAATLAPATPQFIHVLDDKKQRNLSIFLARLPTPAVIKDAILRLDESVVRKDELTPMIDMLPTPDEVRRIIEAEQAGGLLDKCDHFCVALASIPLVNLRLKCWRFKVSFDEMFSGFEPRLETVITACKADGFQYDALLKMTELKDAQGKCNLLQYAARVLQHTNPTALELPSELGHVKAASLVSFSQIDQELADLEAQLKEFEQGCERVIQADKTGGQDPFVTQMGPFKDVDRPGQHGSPHRAGMLPPYSGEGACYPHFNCARTKFKLLLICSEPRPFHALDALALTFTPKTPRA
ncbi:putative actin binding protein [Paratrimastix pyriformis]|uniref:Actin binding protein n=1 Tax=Paratrimastix pyriformis TaxID=342808 RepID=A0ABQ8UXS3_9EUKA|nr:putative actin binding protein [Paratrimastix pyriformis]